MTVLNAFDATQVLSMFDATQTSHEAQVLAASSVYQWTTPLGGGANFFTITAFGVLDDFVAPVSGLPVAGTVNALISTDFLGGAAPFYTATGMSGDLPAMMTNEGYWRAILAGDTTIMGPSAFRLEGAGDFLNIVAGESLIGGADTVTLAGIYNPIGAFNRYSGDADRVTGDADLIFQGIPGGIAILVGGDDTISASGAPILNGDADRIQFAHVTGGDDVITIEAAPTILSSKHALVGDVRDVRSGSTVIGGNDVITVRAPDSGNIGGGFVIYGDVEVTVSNTSIQYGDDRFFVLDGSGAEVFGDAKTVFGGEGGDDVLTASGLSRVFFTGDFDRITGTGSGGDDVFTSADILFSTSASGDIGEGVLAPNETFTGGDDVIDLAGALDVAFYFGDASRFTGRLIGGDDFIRTVSSSSDTIFGDVSTLIGGTSHLTAGSDTIFGGSGSDLIFGDFGTFDSGATFDLSGTGGDQLDGGDGNDSIQGQLGADIIWGGMGNDTLDGNGGGVEDFAIDTVAFDRIALSVFVDLAVGRAIGQGIDTLANFGRVIGSSLNDAISGDLFANELIGGGGNDTLNGREGDDTLSGGAGADILVGGAGNDTYVNPLGDTITELAGGGTDTVESNVTFSLAALEHVENITLTGTASINAGGNAADNVLIGNSGNNILNGSTGIDTMIGGAGNDTYFVDRGGDLTIELAGGGIDLVSSSISRTLSAHVENLNLSGTANIDGNGNTLANIINGNAGNNILRGDAGSDTLNGGAGNDILLGGTASDHLNPGNDTVRDIIRFSAVGDSTGSQRDIVTGMDLNAEDVFHFTVKPTSIAFVNAGALSLATINAGLAAAVNAALAPGGAVLFDPSSGDLNAAGHVFLIIDANGDGIYKPNQDYVVQLINPTGTLTLDDFV